jgi:hypothetical protein
MDLAYYLDSIHEIAPYDPQADDSLYMTNWSIYPNQDYMAPPPVCSSRDYHSNVNHALGMPLDKSVRRP